MGCAASYAEQHTDSAVVGAAAIAKLTRNVFLAAVVPFMAVKHAAGASSTFSAKTLAAAVPVFVGGFLTMAAVRTIGDAQLANGGTALFLFNKDDFKRGADWIGAVLGTKVLLGTGLAAVGLSVNLASFRGAGLNPFIVGAAGASVVGGVGLTVALLVSCFQLEK